MNSNCSQDLVSFEWDVRHGQSIKITVPVIPNTLLSSSVGRRRLPVDASIARRIEGSNPAAYVMAAPDSFVVVRNVLLIFKENCSWWLVLQRHVSPVVPPPLPSNLTVDPSSADARMGGGEKPKQQDAKGMQQFQVQVPQEVHPRISFVVMVGGVLILITCLLNARPGQCIQFKLPMALTRRLQITNESAQIKMKHNRKGWTKDFWAPDLKLQWIWMNGNGDLDLDIFFNLEKAPFVHKFKFDIIWNSFVRMGTL